MFLKKKNCTHTHPKKKFHRELCQRVMLLDSKGLSQLKIPRDFNMKEAQDQYYASLVLEIQGFRALMQVSDLNVRYSPLLFFDYDMNHLFVFSFFGFVMMTSSLLFFSFFYFQHKKPPTVSLN
jgi:hypothetical protein